MEQLPQDELNPCTPSPCGHNAVCKEQNGAGSCTCIAGYYGNPYEGCRPECVTNAECPSHKACIQNKCQDPCPGTCGSNALCHVISHNPTCTCIEGYTGDATKYCHHVPSARKWSFILAELNYMAKAHNWFLFKFTAIEPVVTDPCQPSPCGQYSQCRVINGQAVCSCLPTYIGSPPSCRPECLTNSECAIQLACINQKCVDPCANICGSHAICRVIRHNPICSCQNGFTGDPFSNCYPVPGMLKINQSKSPFLIYHFIISYSL